LLAVWWRSSKPGRIRRPAALAWLALFAAMPLQAASSYGQGSGLPGLMTEALALDDQGLLWIGTQDGLTRFDGHRFVPLELDRAAAVSDRQVRRLLAVPGALYVATASRLLRHDLATRRLEVIRVDGADLSGVWGLRRDEDGTIYAGTDRGELYHWREGAAAAIVPRRLGVEGEPPLPPIVQLAPGRDAIWAATRAGVFRIERGSGRRSPLRLPLPEIDAGQVHARSVHEAADGELWLGFWNDGLVRHDPRTGATRRLRAGTPEAGALRSTSIYSFLETARGLYIGTNRGLVQYRRDCDCLRGLNQPSWDAVDGRGYVVTDLVEEGGGVWVAAWGAGIVRFSASDEAIERQVPVDGRDDTLAHSMIYALHADADRRLWIGTYGSGVQWVDRDARRIGEIWPLQRLPWDERRVESRFIWMLQGGESGLAIGSGIGLMQWRDGALRDLERDLLSVRSYLPLDAQSALVGTMSGLFLRGPDGLQPLALGERGSAPATSMSVWSLATAGDEIWVGTSQGLVRLARETLRWRAAHPPGTGPAQLPGAVVWAQKHDAAGRRWLATSGGLVEARGDAASLQFERHPLPAELGVHGVVSLEFDARGQLWLGTARGLVRYRPDSRRAQLFDSRDGLIGDQLSSNASANDGERLYFGGIGGVIAFDPAAMPERAATLAPQVVRLRQGDGAWQPAPRRLQLPHRHQPLQLEFSARYFERPEQLRYAYRLRPSEPAFTALGDARSAVFSRLPSGSHQLELRASVVGEESHAVVATVLDLDVAPAWFETLWGRLAIVLGLIAFAYLVYFLRVRQVRLYALGLAREVRQRTQELSEAKDALEAANARLQRQVAIDPLTGLANRRGLFEQVAQLDARTTRLAAMLIDLDHFKRLNDEHGHQFGDAVLVDFADLLREVIGPSVPCARYGGEEFLCLLEDATQTALVTHAERLLAALRARLLRSDERRTVGYRASIGLALAQPGESVTQLISRADRALYRAKQNGRDRCELDAPDRATDA
jgi:diguanylate cyclase (GGDEF)-like protein